MIQGPKSVQRVRLAIIFTIILVVTLCSMWVNMVVRKSAADADALAQRTDPDYIVENFRYYRINPDGTPQYEAIGTVEGNTIKLKFDTKFGFYKMTGTRM